jgi:NAD(P)-dependent dehydrogenase (short-subunit alcohol dehydrogenase family)
LNTLSDALLKGIGTTQNIRVKKPVAFITGASRGIGRAVAIELAKQGWDLAGLSRLFDPKNTESGIFEVKQRVEESGGDFLPLQGDVTSIADHAHTLELILEKYGRIDLLVNNASVTPEKPLDILDATTGTFDRVLGVNLRGPFFLTQHIARHMISKASQKAPMKPAIIFITSVAAHVASPARAEYCVSKAGLSMTAAVFAERLAEYGIHVYEIRPAAEGMALPENVGKTVAALVSGNSTHSTGAVIVVSDEMNVRKA